MSENETKRNYLPILLILAIVVGIIVYFFINNSNPNNYNNNTSHNFVAETTLGDVDNYINYLASNQESNSLNYYTVKIYQTFYDNIEDIKDGINSISLAECGWSSEDLNGVINYIAKASSGALTCLIYDNPEFFFLSFDSMAIETQTASYFSDTIVDITFSVEDNFYEDNFNSRQDIDDALQQMENAREEIYADMPAGLSDYEIVVYMNDYLVDNVEYDMQVGSALESPLVHTAYGALVNGIAVCDGYSYALEYLLDGLGITNLVGAGYVVDGTSREGHMWSYVYLYGDWYGVDVTWNDPVIQNPWLPEEDVEEIKNQSKHSYLLLGGDLNTNTGFYSEGRNAENYIYYFGNEYYQLPVPTISKNNFILPTINIEVNESYESGEITTVEINITTDNMLDNYKLAYSVSLDNGLNYSEYKSCEQNIILNSSNDNGLYKFAIITNEGEIVVEYDSVIPVNIFENANNLSFNSLINQIDIAV